MDKVPNSLSHWATLVAVLSGALSAAALIWAKESYDWSLWTFLFVFLIAMAVFFTVGGWIWEAMRRHRNHRENGS